MAKALLRFYAELNDFLPPQKRQMEFIHSFEGLISIKDLIESLDVPCTEVEMMLVNGAPVEFSYIVRDGDRISVDPVFEALNIASLVRLRSHPLRDVRFVLDNHLGKLARHLRLLGFDALYENDYHDEALVQISVDERRILLSRDSRLLTRKQITHGYCVRASNPEQQLIEVIRRFDLADAARPFNRCLTCNTQLELVSKTMVSDKLPPKVREYRDEFYTCGTCNRVFWKGSHYERKAQFVKRILEQ